MAAVTFNLPVKATEAEAYLRSLGFDVCYKGESNVAIEGFSDPGDYVEGNAIWLGSIRYLKLKEGQSTHDVTLLFSSSDFDALAAFPAVMVCDDPRNAFMALVEACICKEKHAGIHPAAIVSDEASIGEGVSIGPNAVIESGAMIGDNSTIDAGCIIRGCVQIGQNCRVFPNCSIGSDGFGFRKMEDGRLQRLPHFGRVVIGDNVEIGACSVIDRGTFRDTTIGSGTKLDSQTGVGHNVQIGKNCLIIGGSVGGNGTIADGCEFIHGITKNRVTIGASARIGIGSVVLRDVEESEECFGNPARVISRNTKNS